MTSNRNEFAKTFINSKITSKCKVSTVVERYNTTAPCLDKWYLHFQICNCDVIDHSFV